MPSPPTGGPPPWWKDYGPPDPGRARPQPYDRSTQPQPTSVTSAAAAWTPTAVQGTWSRDAGATGQVYVRTGQPLPIRQPPAPRDPPPQTKRISSRTPAGRPNPGPAPPSSPAHPPPQRAVPRPDLSPRQLRATQTPGILPPTTKPPPAKATTITVGTVSLTQVPTVARLAYPPSSSAKVQPPLFGEPKPKKAPPPLFRDRVPSPGAKASGSSSHTGTQGTHATWGTRGYGTYREQRQYDPDKNAFVNQDPSRTHERVGPFNKAQHSTSNNLPDGCDPRSSQINADPNLVSRLQEACPQQSASTRNASPGPRPRTRSHSPVFLTEEFTYTSAEDMTRAVPCLPTEQQRLEQRLGTAIGWGLAARERTLDTPPNVHWHEGHAPGSPSHIPFDLMILPEYALRRTSGTNFFSSNSQFFCRDFVHGTCWYGAACNKRHEPFAEVCCSDWIIYGTCQVQDCPFYHREPEGEPLSFLSRQVSVEEFKRASRYRRRVYYWGEQDVIYSGFWRLDGDFYTFKSGRPDLYLRCGLTCGTRTTGTPWTRTTKNDKRALEFRRTQPRRHFDDNGQVRPEVTSHPRN